MSRRTVFVATNLGDEAAHALSVLFTEQMFLQRTHWELLRLWQLFLAAERAAGDGEEQP